jgi:hypothetical protein
MTASGPSNPANRRPAAVRSDLDLCGEDIFALTTDGVRKRRDGRSPRQAPNLSRPTGKFSKSERGLVAAFGLLFFGCAAELAKNTENACKTSSFTR